MKKGWLFLLILWLGSFNILFSSAFAQRVHNTTCPVMPGERVKEKFYVDHAGERIYFCCRPCVKAFKKNPRKYLKNLPTP